MKPFDFPFLADENIHPDLVVFLRQSGVDIDSIAERGDFGLDDENVLKQASKERRVVLTHDRDFGGLALLGAEFIGIIYLRPGHIRPAFTKQTLETIRERAPEIKTPFILVADRTEAGRVKIRVRQF